MTELQSSPLDRGLYQRDMVERAVAAPLRDSETGRRADFGPDGCVIVVSATGERAARRLLGEMLNDLLRRVVEARLASENAP